MKQILDLLQIEEWYGSSEIIEIAKGKYELPTTFKGWCKKIKRKIKSKQK